MKYSYENHASWVIGTEDTLLSVEPWFSVTRQSIFLPDGRNIKDYYQIESPSYVEVVPVDIFGNVITLWRYKHGVRGTSLGFPAGYISTGEQPEAAAKRELHEECAILSDKWQKLGQYTIDGNRGTAMVYIFIAWNCIKTQPLQNDDLEYSEILMLKPEELRKCITHGRIKTLGAICAAMIALPQIENNLLS